MTDASIAQDRRQVEPAPTDDLQTGEISLPKLARPNGLLMELIRCFDGDAGWAGDQILRLQKPVSAMPTSNAAHLN